MPAFTAHKKYTSGSAWAAVKLKATYEITSLPTHVTVTITNLEADYDGTSGSGANLNTAKNMRANALANGIQWYIKWDGHNLYTGKVGLISDRIAISRSGDGSYSIARTTSAMTKNLTMTLDDTAANPQSISIAALASYTVTYNANGGSGNTPSDSKYYGGSFTIRACGFKRTNYAFKQWNTNSSNTGTVYHPNDAYTANASATLYAIWNPIISYNANGGSGTMTSHTKTGSSITLKSCTFTRTNYAFKEWNTNPNGTGTSYAAGYSYTGNTALVLYAIWNPIISYKANGGTGTMTSHTKTGSSITLKSCAFTRSNYSFYHWNTKSDNSGTSYPAGYSYTGSTPLVLYAIWNSIVKFDKNTGTGTMANQTKKYDEALTLNANTFTKTDFRFLGWSTSASATTIQYADKGKYNTNSPVTLYAIWKRTYQKPQVSVIKAYHSDNSGNSLDDGKYATVLISWSVFNTEDGLNEISFVTANFENDSQYYVPQETPTGLSGTSTIVMGGNLDSNIPYNIIVTVGDAKNGTQSTSVTLSAAFFAIDIKRGGHGIAFGKPATKDGVMQIAFPMEVQSSYVHGEPPTSLDKVDSLVRFVDVDENQFGRFGVYTSVNGREGVQIGATRVPSGSSSAVGNLLTLLIDDTGKRYVMFSESAPWRTALGLNGVGTYKSTNMGSSTFALASGQEQLCCSLSLEIGIWVVWGQVMFQNGGTTGTYRLATLGTSDSHTRHGSTEVASPTAGNTTIQCTSVISLTEAETISLYAQQGSGATINIVQGSTVMRAVRIK